MARATGYMITYDDANYMIANEGFTLIGTYTTGLNCLNRSEIEAYMNADTSYFTSYATNRLVPYQLLVPSSIPAPTRVTPNGSAVFVITGTTLNVPYPTTVNQYDILIMHVTAEPNANVSDITGWTKFGTFIMSGEFTMQHFWKRADGTETGSIVIDTGGVVVTMLAAIMTRYQDVIRTGTPYEGLSFNFAQNVTSLTMNNTNSTSGIDRLAVTSGVSSTNQNAGITFNGWSYTFGFVEPSGSTMGMHSLVKAVPTISNPAGPTMNFTSPLDASYISLYLLPRY